MGSGVVWCGVVSGERGSRSGAFTSRDVPARVPMASYKIRRFLAWYFSHANMRLRRMGSR